MNLRMPFLSQMTSVAFTCVKGFLELSMVTSWRASSYTNLPPSTLTIPSRDIEKLCPFIARGNLDPVLNHDWNSSLLTARGTTSSSQKGLSSRRIRGDFLAAIL
jgi:hypothetical protein